MYLETSFVSACVTTRSDIESLYRKQASREWWQVQSGRHELFVSAEVLTELSDPRYPMRDEALRLVHDVPLLEVDEEVRGFAEVLVRERVMPSSVAGDAVHVAVACVHDVDYLLSWNVRHLANPNKLTHLRTIAVRAGYLPPRIVTPDLLWEEME